MSSEAVQSGDAIIVSGVSKCYPLYARPEDRLKQAVLPRLARLVGRAPRLYFKECWAVHDVSLTVARGETVGIIGRNGSGKSTLLQMICGTLAPTAGDIRVSGRVAALLELGSGFNPEFSGRENVYLNGAILGMSREELDAKFERIVAFAELADVIDQPVKTYSSGMYVRLAFAVIAHADADVLVVDEALSVGDVFFAQKCMRFLRDFQRTGTVLFVSHDAAAVTNLCDRAVWLEGGRVMLDGPTKQVCEAYHASVYAHAPVAPAPAPAPEVVDAGADGHDAPAGGATTDAPPPATPRRHIHVARPLHAEAVDDLDPALDQARMRVFRFRDDAAGFGDGGATIRDVRLEDPDGRRVATVDGGDSVRLVVEVEAHRDIPRPIVGFFLKDRLGQQLFGTNTYDAGSPAEAVPAGALFEATYAFRMPYLPRGTYTFDVAVADGDLLDHVQTTWVYDGLVVESIVNTRSTGLVGIPYRSISLRRRP